MAAKNGGKTNFWLKVPDDSVYTLEAKNFVTLSFTVSEINVFLSFMQKFKVAA